MQRYFEYDLTSGLVVRVFACAPEQAEVQATAGAPYIAAGAADPAASYVWNDQILDLPPRPEGGHGLTFDPASAAWVDQRDAAALAEDLDRARAAALAEVAAMVAEIRRAMISDLPGQDMIYLQKAAEASAFVAAGSPDDLSGFPWIAADVGITAPTAAEVAAVILGLSDLWALVGAQMEHARLMARDEIATAGDPAEVAAAVDRFALALSNIGG
ncbi:MAG: hypothetical protein CMM86_09275 [Rhodovulum sp.]|nr:hypothetical protein [Rhodovulum sp.]